MASQDLIRLVGGTGSPYTQKMVALMRYRRLPYALTWGQPGVVCDALGVEKPKPIFMPTFFFEEEGETRAVCDSTPLIRRRVVHQVHVPLPLVSPGGRRKRGEAIAAGLRRATAGGKVGGLEPTEQDWVSLDDQPESLRGLMQEIGRVYTPAQLANARAVQSGDKTWEAEVVIQSHVGVEFFRAHSPLSGRVSEELP